MGGGGEGIEGSALGECAVEGIDGEDGARGKCGDGGREAERVAEPVVLSRGYLPHPPAVKDVGVAQGGRGYREPPPVRAGAVCSISQLLG